MPAADPAPAPGPGPRRFGSFGVRLAALVTLALAIRLLYILVIARAPVGVGGDAGFYHSAANLTAHGNFYARGIFGHAYATAEHPPLYPLLLSVISLGCGETLLAHRIAGCVVGAASVALVGLLGRRVGGDRAGLVAAAIAALYPPLVTADGLVMSEPLFVFLIATALLLACRLVAEPTVRLAAALGAVIGLATLTRGEGLLLLVLLAWPVAYGPAEGRGRRLLAATLATAAVLAPWIARNAVVFHRLILATDSSTVIAGANCHDTYYGHDIGWWSLDCLAHGRTRNQLLAGDASSAPGLRYVRDHAVRLPLVAAVRVLRTFDLFQPLRQGNRVLRRGLVDAVGLAFYYPLLVLAGIGLVLLRREAQPRMTTVMLAPIWMAVFVSAFGWGIGRFRVGADVSLLVLAALALTRLVARPAGADRPSRPSIRRGPPPVPARAG